MLLIITSNYYKRVTIEILYFPVFKSYKNFVLLLKENEIKKLKNVVSIY